MTFTITDPGYDFTVVWVVGIILAVILVWTIIATVGYKRKWWGDWVPGLSWTVTVLFAGFGFFSLALPTAGEFHDHDVWAAQVQSLGELGFENVDLSGDRFVASLDGKYFEGILSETDSYTFQVNEVVAK